MGCMLTRSGTGERFARPSNLGAMNASSVAIARQVAVYPTNVSLQMVEGASVRRRGASDVRWTRRRRHRDHLTVVSLFAGAGGLDLGLEAAGFKVRLCVESDEDARETLRANRPRWKLSEPGDIHELEPADILRQASLRRRSVTLISGGPPCQPFSKSGYWSNGASAGLEDPRADTIRAYLKVVEAALPKVFLFENVSGFAFNGKDEGLQLILRGTAAINRRQGTSYRPQVIHLNAADYGVPQIRQRLFILAHINGKQIEVPSPTHGPLEQAGNAVVPYHTAWDAIGDLDRERFPAELRPKGKWAALLPSIPEGRNYLWHTPRSGGQPLFGWRTRYWSFLLKLTKDEPSWTIQAEPGPATGPFHWRSRPLSIKELTRLQTFPRGYRVVGTRQSAQRQVGNAVPCAVGELLGLEIRRQLLGHRVRRKLRLIPARRGRRPPPEALRPVPARYMKLRGKHRAHPGVGRGPRARARSRRRAVSR
ncbi:MAG: DNA cytosine methyltransferase [Candidatus Rokuibacteriota bacterium]